MSVKERIKVRWRIAQDYSGFIMEYEPSLEMTEIIMVGDGTEFDLKKFNRCIIEIQKFNQDPEILKECPDLTSISYGPNRQSFKGLSDRPRLRSIHIVDMEGSLDPISSCRNLNCILIDRGFNGSLSPLVDMKRLETLKLGDDFAGEIDELSKCLSLKHLEIGDKFNGSLDGVRECRSLSTLIIGDGFTGSIDPIKNLRNMRHLKLGDSFNNTIDALANLEYLNSLAIGDSFNKALEPLSRCRRLSRLELGDSFNESIDTLHCLRHSLRELTIGRGFDQPIDGLRHNYVLYNLVIGSRDCDGTGSTFNGSLEPLSGCSSLWRLVLGDGFNSSIDPLKNCKSLAQIRLGNGFDCDLNAFDMSPNIESIMIGEGFNRSLKPLTTCTRLMYLEIKSPMIKDEVSEHLANIPDLRIFIGSEAIRMDRPPGYTKHMWFF